MELIAVENMTVACNLCGATHVTRDLKDFRESGNYPPTAHFMCQGCKQMATLHASAMPRRLFQHLVAKIARERHGSLELQMFNSLPHI